jgi:hypothetical protein
VLDALKVTIPSSDGWSPNITTDLTRVLQEKVFRDCVRSVVDVLVAMTDVEKGAAPAPADGSGKGSTKVDPGVGTIGRFSLLEDAVVGRTVCGCLMKGMEWNDSTGFRRIVCVFSKLFQAFSQLDVTASYFGTDVFKKCVTGLISLQPWTLVKSRSFVSHNPPLLLPDFWLCCRAQEAQGELLLLISDIYCT